jgi:glycosyltransferase involved in cell wall biosynthesis
VLDDTPAAAGLPVSCVIPAFNREELLPRAILSVLSQTRPPSQIIVVDDGSADRTAEVAAAHGVEVVRHEVNRGLPEARNTGIAAATQGWVAFLDSDDEWLPHHLEALWGLRDGHMLVAAAAFAVGEGFSRYSGPVARDPVVLSSPADLLFPSNIVPVSATLLRREAIVDAGGFRTRGGAPAEDLDLWVRVLEHGTGVVTPAVGVLYHVHSEQMSSDVARQKTAHLEIIRSSGDRPWYSAELERRYRGAVLWDLFRLHLRQGDRRRAFRHLIGLLSNAGQLRGLLQVWGTRHKTRRRSHMFSPGGEIRVIKLSAPPGIDELVSVIVRPPGLVVTDSSLLARLLGRFGISTSQTADARAGNPDDGL